MGVGLRMIDSEACLAESITDALGYSDRRMIISAAIGSSSAINAMRRMARSGDSGNPSGVSLLLQASHTRAKFVGSLMAYCIYV